jgi:hypothetical protein
MKEIEIVLDKGYGEKKIIISDSKISFDNEIVKDSNHEFIVIAANGIFPPPFEKGSRVLKELRETSNQEFKDWKLVFPLDFSNQNLFNIDLLSDQYTKMDDDANKNWGIWFHQCSDLENPYPSILVLNFPLFLISRYFQLNNFEKEIYTSFLSQIYRTIVSAVSAIMSFYLEPNKNNRSILFSDIGNNLIDREIITKWNLGQAFTDDIYKIRVKVFTEVLSNWLSFSSSFDKALIACGEGLHSHLLERAWDEQVDESKEDLNEYKEAINLRSKNRQLLQLIKQKQLSKSFEYVVDSAIQTYNIEPSLSADLIQTRTLVETITKYLCEKNNLKSKEANLMAYILRLEESKIISPWITSYCHIIRLLGNEAAHTRSETLRRPERPIGKDLVVIHAALYRILSFYQDEM